MRINDDDVLDDPKKFQSFTNKSLSLEEVSCGGSHIAAIALASKDDTSGYVYTWGKSDNGQLGYDVGKDKEFNSKFIYLIINVIIRV